MPVVVLGSAAACKVIGRSRACYLIFSSVTMRLCKKKKKKVNGLGFCALVLFILYTPIYLLLALSLTVLWSSSDFFLKIYSNYHTKHQESLRVVDPATRTHICRNKIRIEQDHL